MSNGVCFCMDQDVCNTALNALKAIVADFITEGEVPGDDQLRREIESFVGKMPSLYRTGWQWMVRALEMSPLAMGYRHKFSNLSRAEQVEVLQKYEKSSNYVQRGTVLGMKNLLIMIYFSQPELERILGYDHQCLLPAK